MMCQEQDSFSLVIFASSNVLGLAYPYVDSTIAEDRVLSSAVPMSQRA